MKNCINRRRRIRTAIRDLIHMIELLSGVVVAATGLVLLLLAASALIEQKLDDLLKTFSRPAVRPEPNADVPGRPEIPGTGVVRRQSRFLPTSQPRTRASVPFRNALASAQAVLQRADVRHKAPSRLRGFVRGVPPCAERARSGPVPSGAANLA